MDALGLGRGVQEGRNLVGYTIPKLPGWMRGRCKQSCRPRPTGPANVRTGHLNSVFPPTNPDVFAMRS